MDKQEIKNKIIQGKIFIYPTDTIYGIGCDASNINAVNKIKKIKSRDKDKPLSIIAPSKDWIKEHCIVDADLDKYLPGPYTLLLEKKDLNFLSHISNNNKLGIRIPDNEFCRLIQETGRPFITTSVNLSGEPFAVRISDIKQEILDKVDEVIDVGELSGRPSALVINGKEIKR